jgi:hypothetical protein
VIDLAEYDFAHMVPMRFDLLPKDVPQSNKYPKIF